ncbi:MAG: M48 family metalloprotease [Bryobacteraceae bacterium]
MRWTFFCAACWFGAASAVTLPDAALDAYINKVGRALASHVDDRNFSITFTIYEDGKAGSGPPAAPGAFPYAAKDRLGLEPVAFADGPIHVPLGLLRKVDSEAELAGMLAHSIAHIALRHGARIGTGGVGDPTSVLGLARKYELDADALAVLILAEAGYDPSALVKFLKKPPPDDRSEQVVVASSLPPVASRIAEMEKVIATLPAANYTAQTGEFDAIDAKLKSSR